MGACYSVDLTVKVKDEAAAVKALQDYIKANPCKAEFSLERWAANGIGTATLDHLVTIMLAGWPGQPVRKEAEPNGFTAYHNDFSASYGWQRVMEGMFDAMGSSLEDGSEFVIEADNSRVTYTVEDGEVC